MTEPTEEMKAMARRCAEKAYHEGYDTMTAMMLAKRAALAAIIEARKEMIRSLRHDFDDWPDYVALADVADALENQEQPQ